ncbi:MAG: hypothetical protein V7K90_01335 [Nostoc sp.]|uniref:hypothetical protein n=1 Tax=Nostoc sp. TaxID=1180 RepID=UPI002FF934F8
MSSAAITTVIKMMESLPNEVQDRIAEHLREYINDLQDEIRWNESFQRTQPKVFTDPTIIWLKFCFLFNYLYVNLFGFFQA